MATIHASRFGLVDVAARDRNRPVAIVPARTGKACPLSAPSLVLYPRAPRIARLCKRVNPAARLRRVVAPEDGDVATTRPGQPRAISARLVAL